MSAREDTKVRVPGYWPVRSYSRWVLAASRTLVMYRTMNITSRIKKMMPSTIMKMEWGRSLRGRSGRGSPRVIRPVMPLMKWWVLMSTSSSISAKKAPLMYCFWYSN